MYDEADANIPQPTGFSRFALHMQTPYFAIRKHVAVRRDRRPDGNAGVLRNSKDLSFLIQFLSHVQTPHRAPCLYSAHVSLGIVGIDDWRWTAWMFVDSYFDPGEAVDDYDGETRDGARPDPLMRGEFHVHAGMEQDARRYFLRASGIWLKRVGQEWHAIIQFVKEVIDQK
jgi:hypothetical protein